MADMETDYGSLYALNDEDQLDEDNLILEPSEIADVLNLDRSVGQLGDRADSASEFFIAAPAKHPAEVHNIN